MKNRTLLLTLCITLFSLIVLFTGPAYATPRTPEQVLSEMTWGVNLGNLYMSDKVYFENGKDYGYCPYAPFGIALWFWDGSFDWMVNYKLHEEQFSASINIPAWSEPQDDNLFDGMFCIGVFIKKDTAQDITLVIDNARIITSNGAEVAVPSLNGIFELNDFGEFNENGFASCMLDIDPVLAPDHSFSNGIITADITLIDVPFSPSGKADYFFEYQREEIDQYEYTNAYIDQGANVFRLPVTWSSFVDDQTFMIDQEWLDAVRTEVEYIISQGAYCILNMHDDYLSSSYVGDHWEDCWMMDEYKEYVDARYRAVWAQIAEYFRDYPDTLIFEAANEPTMTWDPSRQTSHEFAQLQTRRTNELNEIFVDTVRNTGGNNTTRILCLAVANYNSASQLNGLTIPDDDYIIATLHSYQEMEDNTPGSVYDPDFDYVTKTDEFFDAVADFTNRTGVPILISEVGATHRIESSERVERIAYYFQKCREYGTPALWWEDYFLTDDGYYYWMYDVANRTFPEPEVLLAIQESYDTVPGEPLAAARIFMENSDVQQGQTLLAEIEYQDPDTQWTEAYVVASDNRSYYDKYILDDNRVIFSTYNMPPGAYKLTIISNAQNRSPGYSSVYFHVQKGMDLLDDEYYLLHNLWPLDTKGYDISFPDVFQQIEVNHAAELQERYDDDYDITIDFISDEGISIQPVLYDDGMLSLITEDYEHMEETSVLFELTIRWGDFSDTALITVDYIRPVLPDITYSSINMMTAGETYELGVDISDPGWTDNYFLYYDFNDESAFDKWNDPDYPQSFYVKPLRPGIYYGGAHIHAGNMRIQQEWFRFVVTDDNGCIPDIEQYEIVVLPEDLQIIESQAFAGIWDLIVDIPAGVTAISEDAFEPETIVICDEESYAYQRCSELNLIVVKK